MKGPSEKPTKKRRKIDLNAKIITDEEYLKAIKDKEEPLTKKRKLKKNTNEGPSKLFDNEELGVSPIDQADSEFVCASENDSLAFNKSGENKKMLFDLIQQSIQHTLNDRVVYFSNIIRCMRISQHEARPCPELACTHEEADTKLLALVKAAIHQAGQAVMVRSPSGDIDVTALFIAHDFMGVRVFLDSGVGKSRKIVDLKSSTLSSIKRRAVVGHSPATIMCPRFSKKGKNRSGKQC